MQIVELEKWRLEFEPPPTKKIYIYKKKVGSTCFKVGIIIISHNMGNNHV